MSKNYEISSMLVFKKFSNRVNRMLLVQQAKQGNYRLPIRGIFTVSGFLNKVRIIIALILPNRVLNRFFGNVL